MLLRIPNLALDDVPIGKDENANIVHSYWGEIEQKASKSFLIMTLQLN